MKIVWVIIAVCLVCGGCAEPILDKSNDGTYELNGTVVGQEMRGEI